jgi:hypothetical protein
MYFLGFNQDSRIVFTLKVIFYIISSDFSNSLDCAQYSR